MIDSSDRPASISRSPIGKDAKLNELILLAMIAALNELGKGYEQAVLEKHANHAADLWSQHCTSMTSISWEEREHHLALIRNAIRLVEAEGWKAVAEEAREALAALSVDERLIEVLGEARTVLFNIKFSNAVGLHGDWQTYDQARTGLLALIERIDVALSTRKADQC